MFGGTNVAARAVFDGKNQIAFAAGVNITTRLVLHEMGHIVDWHIASEEGFWSNENFIPYHYVGDNYVGNPDDAPGSTANPRDDFADTFAWNAMTVSGLAPQGNWQGPASQNRIVGLNYGLHSLVGEPCRPQIRRGRYWIE